jgi:two-component system, NtrC family, response regulator AtoC
MQMLSDSTTPADSYFPPRVVCALGHRALLGDSFEMQKVIQQIERIAASNVSVLIHGESGTGKELIARALHSYSTRAHRPFVALNVAAIPEGLVESELFGHERGAYTGAISRYQGKVQQANGGTLFLDEIGDLALSSQVKLLRVIQERQFHRLGGSELIRADFRIVAATHQNLREFIRAERFREDLYFRLAVFEIEVPPLRERKQDISLLANRFIADFKTESKVSADGFSPQALDALLAYDWPGNVRELQNAVQRALLLCDKPEIQPEHLPETIRQKNLLWTQNPPNGEPEKCSQLPVERMDEIERKALTDAIDRCSGNLSMVIRELQIGRGRLYRKLKKYNLMELVRVNREAIEFSR